MRAVGGAMLSSSELGEMLCSVSCCGVVFIMPVLQVGGPRFESQWQQTLPADARFMIAYIK